MERSKEITKLRSRTDPPIPDDLTLDNLVSALVRRRPAERPDAATLLEVLEDGRDTWNFEAEVQLKAQQRELEEKDKEIERLRELLKKHGLHEE